MQQDILLPFDLPAVARKKVSIAFDGGMLSSNAGVLLLRGVEQRLGIAKQLAACLTDRRDPDRIDHPLVEMLRLRMFAIAAGYEDTNDCTTLRDDPVFKMAVGHAPESGAPLCSQPTMSRLENAPRKTEIARMMGAMVDLFCASWKRAPRSIILDIDDTFDAVHGKQQLSLFNAHYDERCFLPIHIYEGTSGKPVAMILRAGKTPTGVEVRMDVDSTRPTTVDITVGINFHAVRHTRVCSAQVGKNTVTLSSDRTISHNVECTDVAMPRVIDIKDALVR
jgi:hypothetical protein